MTDNGAHPLRVNTVLPSSVTVSVAVSVVMSLVIVVVSVGTTTSGKVVVSSTVDVAALKV